MKLTPEIKSYVRKLNNRYYKSLGIKSTVIPTLTFTVKEFNKIEGPEFNRVSKIKDRYGLVCFNKKSCTMFLNVRHHKDVAELYSTFIHEMVHLKYPNLQHGATFNNHINNIIMSDRY
jgi:hypothetical protein